jgi:AraC-like DNA-binding protein
MRRVSSWSIVISIATGHVATRCAAFSIARAVGTACSRRSPGSLRLSLERRTACRTSRRGAKTCSRGSSKIDAERVVLACRFHDKLSPAELVRSVFSSPFHLAQVFRRETGLSLHRQLTRLRLRHALEHLAGNKPDLTVLALDLGFSSHAHFSHPFRREFGSAPSQFRRSPKETSPLRFNYVILIRAFGSAP